MLLSLIKLALHLIVGIGDWGLGIAQSPIPKLIFILLLIFS